MTNASAPRTRGEQPAPVDAAAPAPWSQGDAMLDRGPDDDLGALPEAVPGSAQAAALRGALVDSRQRWRDLVGMAADFAFETDAWGRFVFVAPDPALGWAAATLIGQTADLLLVEDGGASGYNPFRPTAASRRRRVWLKQPGGGSICMAFSAMPVLDDQSRIIGARGVGHDLTEQDGREAEAASALRRSEVLDHIMWRMRKEVLAPRMMQAVMDALSHATASEGLAVLDMIGNGQEPAVLHSFGRSAPSVLPAAITLLELSREDPADAVASDGRRVLVCPTQTRFGEQVALVLWRLADSRGWDLDDRTLAASSMALVRVILEHEAIQRDMVRNSRTDQLTGLLNRAAFIDEIGRRFDRLEVEGLPGALLFIDLDHFKTLNDARGHEAGDEALRTLARLLRVNVRPMDLAARLGGDEFALWLDGAEELAAAERAEQLRVSGPEALAHLSPVGVSPVTLSIGIAARWPGRGEDVEALLHRADRAMYDVKRGGRGNWRVRRPEDPE